MFPGNAPSSFGKNDQLSQMSFAPNIPGISTGNAIIDQLISMLLSGQNIGARPHLGQSALEAHLQRERSNEYLRTMRQQFGQQPLFRKFGGLDTNSSWGSIASIALGSPDGISNHPLMRAFNGGNPIKAAMALQSNMTGFSQYMNTGSWENASPSYVNNVMEGMTREAYRSRVYTSHDAAEARNNESRKLLDFIDKDPLRRKRFEGVISTDDDGKEKVNWDKLDKIRRGAAKGAKGKLDELGKLTEEEYAKVLEATTTVSHTKSRVGLSTPTSINFENTRGFEIQDLTKAYSMSRDLGLYNERQAYDRAFEALGTTDKYATADQRNQAQIAVSRGFFRQAGRVANAMSDLSGAGTAEEATKQLNSLLGNSNLDVGSSENASYIEDLLRRVKGTARTAGISIDAMMGMVQEGKALASRYSNLQNLGGVTILESTLKSFRQAQVLSTALGSDTVRRYGGMTGYTNRLQSLDMESMNHQSTQQAYALRAMVDASNASPDAKNAMRDLILNQANDPGADRSPAGYNRFYEKLSQMGIGGNVGSIILGSESKTAADAGRRAAEEDRRLGRKVYDFSASGNNHRFDQDMAFVEVMIGDRVKQGLVKNSKGEVITDQRVAMRQFQEDMMNIRREKNEDGTINTLNSSTAVMLKYGVTTSNMGYDTLEEQEAAELRIQKTLYNNDPAVKRENEKLQKVINDFAAQDANFAERNARFRVPIGTLLAQEVMQNGFSRGFDGLMGILSDPGKERADAILKANRLAMTEGSNKSILDSLWEQKGGAMGMDEDKVRRNLAKQGKSPAEIEAIMAQRGNLSSEMNGDRLWDDPDELFASIGNLGAAGLTVEQILAAAPMADKDEAEAIFEKSRAKELGASFDDVYQTSMLLRQSGYVDSKDQRKRYGKQVMSKELFAKMTAEGGVLAMADTLMKEAEGFGHEGSVAKINALLDTMESSSEAVVSSQGSSIRAAMQKAGYIVNGKVDPLAISHGARANFGKELTGLLGDKYSAAGGGLDLEKIKSAVMGTPSDPVLARMLKDEGFVTVDADGKVTAVNEDRLKLAKARDEANAAIANAPGGSAIDAELKGISSYWDTAKQKAEEIRASVGQGKDKEAEADPKKQQESSILDVLLKIAGSLSAIAGGQ